MLIASESGACQYRQPIPGISNAIRSKRLSCCAGWARTEPLVVITYGVVFVIGEMVEHQGVIVLVGADIGGVEVAEIEEFLQ